MDNSSRPDPRDSAVRAQDSDITRQDDVSVCIWALLGLWCCVLVIPTLFFSLIFLSGPVFPDEDCRHVFSFGDAVGAVLIVGSFLMATFLGLRAGSFLGRLMIRSSALRRVWTGVLGLTAAVTSCVVATAVLSMLWTGVFWLSGSWDFLQSVCEVVPG